MHISELQPFYLFQTAVHDMMEMTVLEVIHIMDTCGLDEMELVYAVQEMRDEFKFWVELRVLNKALSINSVQLQSG